MSTQNEESNTQQLSLSIAMEHPTLEQGELQAGVAVVAESAQETPRAAGARQGVVDNPVAGMAHIQKTARTRAGKSRGQAQTEALDPGTPAAKPSPPKRARTQPDRGVKDQSETVSKPRRTSTRKAAKVVVTDAPTTPARSDIPPITPAAIEFLGKQDATAADVLQLAPDSLAFVQYHFKHMQQLEAVSQSTNAYLIANARPVGPAFQYFLDALAKQSNHGRSQTAVQTKVEVPELIKRQPANEAISSYSQQTVTISAYAPVVVQLRKLELPFDKMAVQAPVSESTLDDRKRANNVLGTARIIMSARVSDLTPKEATDLVAGDVEEVRGMLGIAGRRIALNAMGESGLAQPRYQAELVKQPPDLIEPAKQAHKAIMADWHLTNEVSSTLSYVAEAGEPLTKEETTTIASKAIEAIRAIENRQYRQDALALSHQIGYWQPLYKEAFSRQAPDLVALADTAYRAEEAKTALGGKVFHGLENSIEQSPLQLVTAVQHGSTAPRVATSQPSPTAENFPEQPTATDASGEKHALDPAPRSSFRRRLGLVLGDVANWAIGWWSSNGQDRPKHAAGARVLLDKSTAGPAAADVKSDVVPESVAWRFLKVEREYYFHDRTPAFSDRGNKLATHGADPDVVRSLVEIAKARGWDTITVKGTEEFRRSVWIEAAHMGLAVAGYKPTPLDLAELANRPANNTVEKGAGRETSGGIKSPFSEKQTAHANSTQAPATAEAAPTTPGPEGPQRDQELVVKAQAFQDAKPAFVVKKYPDLAAAYGIVAAAKAFAIDKLPEAARDDFVDIAKRHMVEKILAGEHIQGPKIYLTPAKTPDVGDQTITATDSPDQGKTPRAKAVERER
ncbi:LPD7 domain-containing protein [Massilia sp. DD77]|uniref:LPD7 domain-containing protein n=1 Tax=Massilia sp. DD77 TaxID=3109349 RepID=UPI002FFEE41A